MEMCCDCRENAEVGIIYPASILFCCQKCLVERIKKFSILVDKEYLPPIVIPLKYLEIEKISGNWFPIVIIKFGETETMYGMKKEKFEKRQEELLSTLEMNIP